MDLREVEEGDDGKGWCHVWSFAALKFCMSMV